MGKVYYRDFEREALGVGMKSDCEPIRVLQVLGRLDRGGAETMIMNLYRRIDRERIQFDFVLHTTDECEYSAEVRKLGGRIYSVPAYGVGTAWRYKKAWKKFFEAHPEYQIIHSHIRSTASIILKCAKKYGLHTIAHSHNTRTESGIKGMVKRFLQKGIVRYADDLMACSKRSGEWLFGTENCRGENFYVLNNAIDTTIFKYNEETRLAIREELGVGDETVIGHIGRMEEQKNHTRLLTIFREYINENKNVKLWLIGEGPLRSTIEEQIKNLGLGENVRILGVRDDVPRLMQAMDAILFPSLYEGLPVTLVEAQAAGLPILMSDTITDEVILTNLVATESLDSKDSVWVQGLARMLDLGENGKQSAKNSADRTGYDSLVADKGYDITMTAEWLTKFYEERTER